MKANIKKSKGFTLVELLIAIAVMGVVAVISIPTLYSVPAEQSSKKFNQIAKNTVYSIMSAYQTYKLTSAYTTNGSGSGISNITPYLNYVSLFTGTVRNRPLNGTISCTGAFTCLTIIKWLGVMVSEQ